GGRAVSRRRTRPGRAGERRSAGRAWLSMAESYGGALHQLEVAARELSDDQRVAVACHAAAREVTRAKAVRNPAADTSSVASTSMRAGKLQPTEATTGPMLAPMNSTSPVSAMPPARFGAAVSPKRVIIAGMVIATPVTNTK